MPQPRQSFIHKLLRLRLFLVVNILVLFFLVFSLGREYLRNYQIDREISIHEQEIAELDSRNFELLDLAKYYQTEEYLEAEAREKFGQKRPGENVVVIIDLENEFTEDGLPIIEGTTPFDSQDSTVSNSIIWWWFFLNKNRFNEYKDGLSS